MALRKLPNFREKKVTAAIQRLATLKWMQKDKRDYNHRLQLYWVEESAYNLEVVPSVSSAWYGQSE